jgi:hypothetical protein
MISKETAVQLLHAGANLKISMLSKEACVELARIAKARGVRLEIKGSLSADSMLEIARVGGANVLLDVS